MIAGDFDARFPRSRRTLRSADIRHVFRRPSRSSDAYFAVAARRNDPPGTRPREARLGLAISRKALPRAVDRNRVKRIVREAFRQTRWPCGLDVVVVGRAGLRDSANAAIRRSVDVHFATIRARLCEREQGQPAGDAIPMRPAAP